MTKKNIAILGVITVLLISLFTMNEIWRANLIIQGESDPVLSTERGFIDAENDYSRGYAQFKLYGLEALGVEEDDLEAEYSDYAPYMGFMCDFATYIVSYALNIDGYRYNKYYVLGYNIRLKTLVSKND